MGQELKVPLVVDGVPQGFINRRKLLTMMAGGVHPQDEGMFYINVEERGGSDVGVIESLAHFRATLRRREPVDLT